MSESGEPQAFTAMPTGHLTPPQDPQNDSQFVNDLTQLLNRYSRENEANTPDFILCQFLIDSLANANRLVQQRDSWYGINPHPGWQMQANTLEGENG